MPAPKRTALYPATTSMKTAPRCTARGDQPDQFSCRLDGQRIPLTHRGGVGSGGPWRDWWRINMPGAIPPSPAKPIMWIPVLARVPRWAPSIPMGTASMTSGATSTNGPGTGTIHEPTTTSGRKLFPMRMGYYNTLVDEGNSTSTFHSDSLEPQKYSPGPSIKSDPSQNHT